MDAYILPTDYYKRFSIFTTKPDISINKHTGWKTWSLYTWEYKPTVISDDETSDLIEHWLTEWCIYGNGGLVINHTSTRRMLPTCSYRVCCYTNDLTHATLQSISSRKIIVYDKNDLIICSSVTFRSSYRSFFISSIYLSVLSFCRSIYLSHLNAYMFTYPLCIYSELIVAKLLKYWKTHATEVWI